MALAEPHADPVTDHPAGVEGRAGAMAVSMMAAGPIFLASMMLMIEGGRESIGERTMMAVVGTMISLPFTVIIGAIFGLAPIAAGVTALARLGVHDPVARNRWLWAATGAGMGLAIAGMFDAQIVTIPLVLTSVACAMIAHRAISWHDPEPA
ncbi:hypothetical protein [Sphingomonas sp.]|uniref:hypothetical protein n=1 Tax=Sphingomonas sp. TaxID=28214 RepID=UPI002DD62192|nr:hypothetical protein [Sphingomonas sp.]